MGTSTASPALSLFPALREQLFPSLSGVPSDQGASLVPKAGASFSTNDAFGSNVEEALAEQYDAIVYRAEATQLSLSARLEEISARIAEGGDDGASVASFQATQLEFDFFAETRVEELVRFQERTAALGEGLEGARATSLVEASRSVSARFEFSLTISGAALQGFGNAVEGTADTDALLGKVLDLTGELLATADALFDAFFSDFESEFFGAAGVDFGTQFEQLLAEFLGGAGFPPALSSGDGAGEQGAVAGSAQFVQLEFSFSFSGEITVTESAVKESDPIILDLDGDGFELTTYQQGARFDILGNGSTQQTAFVQGGDAFLALDRNGDGVINDGTELFGDQRGAAHGFAELSKLDSNGDGIIDRRDKEFGRLLLFRDDGDGVTEGGELLTLEEAGIASLSLQYRDVNERISGGNRLEQIASYRRTDGTLGRSGDAVLNFTT